MLAEPLQHLGLIHPEIAQTLIAEGTARCIEQRPRAESRRQTAQLGRSQRAHRQIDEVDLDPPLLEEAEGLLCVS